MKHWGCFYSLIHFAIIFIVLSPRQIEGKLTKLLVNLKNICFLSENERLAKLRSIVFVMPVFSVL